MVSWEYYSRRRNINLNDFMKARNLENYEHYVAETKSMEIIPMDLQTFTKQFVKEEKKEDKPVQKPKDKKVIPKPPVRKKRKYTRRKKQ